MKTAVQIAIGELGKEEIPRGSNWGEHVKKYLASIGIKFAASWCMAFVYWCVQEACKTQDNVRASDTEPCDTKLHRSGGVLDVWNHTDPRYKHTDHPQAGDIFIMSFGNGLGHTGLVESVEGDILHTIEGNTNDTGSREGYEVCRRTRHVDKIKGYIRL